MILWLALFLLVVAISFVLAYQSMQDYQEIPTKSNEEYGLFLVRNPRSLNSDLLDSIHSEIIKEGLVVSLERLFKGSQSALVIFGPKKVLAKFANTLNLLELEDYTKINKDHTVAWEVGVKNPKQAAVKDIDNFFKGFPLLSEAEQFWWQLTLQAKPEKRVKLPNIKGLVSKPTTQSEIDYLKSGKKPFQSQIRAVVFAVEPDRRKRLAEALQNLSSGHLTKVPKPFTSSQIVDFYEQRSLGYEDHNPQLTTEEILGLSLFP